MLCVKCGGDPTDRSSRARVRLRATGRSDEPFVMVCEQCGGDIESAGTVTPVQDAATRLDRFGLTPHAPPLFQRRQAS